MGPAQANRTAYLLHTDTSIPWLGPVSTPHEWSQAVAAARGVAIEAARRRQTITYGECRLAEYEATNMKVGHNQYAELTADINELGDGCMLSAIIVKADTGDPGAGFYPFARASGFDAPLSTLQRQVWDHLGE